MTPQETERVLAALRGAGALGAAAGSAPVQQEVRLAGERWLAQLRPLHDAGEVPVGVALSLVSLDRELEGYRQVRNVLLAVGGAALLAALALSFLLARRVTRPIQELVRATTAAREGRYDVTTPPGGSGEVLALANSFNALLAELRERREMADYVEKLARNLPEAAGRAAEAPARPAAAREATLVGVELRRHGRLRPGQQAGGLLEKLAADLRTAATALAAQGGTIEAVHGHRLIAAFTGASRSERALAAVAELGAALGRPEHAFDEVEPPAAALASGELVSGSLRLGEESERALLGLPLQQIEGLLREAAEGEILVSPARCPAPASSCGRAGE
jgi:HAMP domain-containing protein